MVTPTMSIDSPRSVIGPSNGRQLNGAAKTLVSDGYQVRPLGCMPMPAITSSAPKKASQPAPRHLGVSGRPVGKRRKTTLVRTASIGRWAEDEIHAATSNG